MLDLGSALRFIAAFALVVGLIALLSYVAKRWRGIPTKRGGGRRLQLVEAMGIDAKRRLVIVRADDKEHVLLLGGETDLLLDTLPVPAASATTDMERLADA